MFMVQFKDKEERKFPENAYLVTVSLSKATVFDDFSNHKDGGTESRGCLGQSKQPQEDTCHQSHTHLAHT